LSSALLITSAQNSKIKLVNRLRSKRGRQSEGRFVIDYERDLRRALQMGYKLDLLLYCADLIDMPSYMCPNTHGVSPALFHQVSYRDNPDGIIAVMRFVPRRELHDLELSDFGPYFLALVGLHVPGNIGALLRSADAAGINTIMMVDIALDLYNPNIIRSSTGACFRDNIFQLSSRDALGFLKAWEWKFPIAAADVAGERTLYEADFSRVSVIALGSEDNGLPSDWKSAADQIVRIPMQGTICDSLNVSVSGALFMYELQRQRRRD